MKLKEGNIMNYEIVELNINDVESYIRINSLAWKQNYKGIVNDDFLELINTEEEIQKGIDNLKKFINDGSKRFLLKVDNEYLGLFRVRKTKYENYLECGELGALYLLNDIKGIGYGKILFKRAIEELKKAGYKDIIIGCLKGNPSNNFYKYMGGEFVGTSSFELPNQVLEENLYLYRNIN